MPVASKGPPALLGIRTGVLPGPVFGLAVEIVLLEIGQDASHPTPKEQWISGRIVAVRLDIIALGILLLG
jgi:hypothetical protein